MSCGMLIGETQRDCPKCGEFTAYQVRGALYYSCETCHYAWEEARSDNDAA